MWEGYRRHTGPELDTGGMRGSKRQGSEELWQKRSQGARMPLLGPSLVARVLTKERDDAVVRAAAADKVVAEAQQKLELAQSMETRRETAHAEQLRRIQKECASLQASVKVGNDRLMEAQEKLEARQLKMAQHQAEVEAHLETCAKLAAASARADACEAQLAVVNGQVARQDEQLLRLQPQLAAAQTEVTMRRSELAALEASKQSAVAALQAQVAELNKAVASQRARAEQAEALSAELEGDVAAQQRALEAGEAGRQLLRQEGETVRAELAATAARVAELLKGQDEARQRHELALVVEERTEAASAEAEVRKARVELLLDEMHERIELREQRDHLAAKATHAADRISGVQEELRASRAELADALRREAEGKGELDKQKAQLRRSSQRNAELQTNVAITTQMGELDKLVALLQERPKGRPAAGPTREVRAAQISMPS